MVRSLPQVRALSGVGLKDSNENRMESRFATEIQIKAKNIHETEWLKAKIVNLSRCGACIEGKLPWKMGNLLEVVTLLKSSEKKYHSLLASVAWTKGKYTGIRFLFEP